MSIRSWNIGGSDEEQDGWKINFPKSPEPPKDDGKYEPLPETQIIEIPKARGEKYKMPPASPSEFSL